LAGQSDRFEQKRRRLDRSGRAGHAREDDDDQNPLAKNEVIKRCANSENGWARPNACSLKIAGGKIDNYGR
jgi:hypothetical protein